ncbi:MAG: TonB-dependent receptor [Deltaproteobacteria bacterium]|nr:TonB-dependent receptor [Deltaproteobacteria bacterium]
MRVRAFWVLAAVCLAPAIAAGQEEPIESSPGDDSALALFALDSQLEQSVVSSTRTEQRGAQTPAVVTVVSAEEIQARGYRSLAEVLRAVPGVYDVYDLVSHNVGVRGINGGARASGTVSKLMIDGLAVDFRPSTGNFFGEELVPMEAVERVEIIRGPASALYGADAFLGVVNVVTRSGAQVRGAQLTGQVGSVRSNLGGGGTALVGAATGPLDVLVAAGYSAQGRGGLWLPSSSPTLASDASGALHGRSSTDMSRPRSLLAKLSLEDVAKGKLAFLASVQQLDAAGRFQDFGPLASGTRIGLVNQHYQVTYSVQPHPMLDLEASGQYFNSEPASTERLDIGRPDFVYLRSVRATGFGVAGTSRLRLLDQLHLVLGADYLRTENVLQTFDTLLLQDVLGPEQTVLRSAGTVVPGEQHGAHKTFGNAGAFAQAIVSFDGAWSATAGARVDSHTIYGVNPSARVGVVYAPSSRQLSLKLLYGSSFKAPSADQLYTQPMRVLDIEGNERLEAQSAHTFELAAGYGVGDRLEITANAFATYVLGRVEFVQRSLFLQAQNVADEWVVGGELDARAMIARPVQLRLTVGAARSVSRSQKVTSLSSVDAINPLYPTLQAHLQGDYFFPWAGLRFGAEVSYVGPRTSSQSNALVKGSDYEIPGYFYTAVSLSTAKRKLIGERETSVALRVADVLNSRWAEPGFGGIDVPTQGVTASLVISQSL